MTVVIGCVWSISLFLQKKTHLFFKIIASDAFLLNLRQILVAAKKMVVFGRKSTIEPSMQTSGSLIDPSLANMRLLLPSTSYCLFLYTERFRPLTPFKSVNCCWLRVFYQTVSPAFSNSS